MAFPLLSALKLFFDIFSSEGAKTIWTWMIGAKVRSRVRWAFTTMLSGIIVKFPLIAVATWIIIRGKVWWFDIGKKLLWKHPWFMENYSFLSLVHFIDAVYISFWLVVLFGVMSVMMRYKSRGEILKITTHEFQLERMKAELERNYNMARAVMDISPNSVVILDGELVIQYVNPGYQDLAQKFDLDKEPVGKSFFHVFWYLIPIRRKIIASFSCTCKTSFKENVEIGRGQFYSMEIMKVPVIVNGNTEEVVVYQVLLGEACD